MLRTSAAEVSARVCNVLLIGIVLQCGANPVRAAEWRDFTQEITPGINTELSVSPGQRFYTDMWVKPRKTFRVANSFESTIPGAMGLPFHFAIDDPLLQYHGRNEECEFYSPENGKVRAWHALFGSVIDPGDFVGLKVCKSGPITMEWVVDNSKWNSRRHNSSLVTRWHRQVRSADPQIIESSEGKKVPVGEPIRYLDYLGVQAAQVKVRYSELHADDSRTADEYTFPIGADGVSRGLIMDCEFEIKPGSSQRATIIVKTKMGVEFALPSSIVTSPGNDKIAIAPSAGN